MSDDTLAWLQDYYLSLCDGDWEHGFGPKIGTLDNPGWTFEFHLEGTPMENVSFEPVVIERSEHDWIHCKVEAVIFKSYGGPLNLTEMLQMFRDWVERTKTLTGG